MTRILHAYKHFQSLHTAALNSDSQDDFIIVLHVQYTDTELM